MGGAADLDGLARAIASGEASVAVGGSADGATIVVIHGDVLVSLDRPAFEALGERLPRALPPQRYDLPRRSPTFVGRYAKEAELCRILASRSGPQPVVWLKGYGGMGKTELAVRVARKMTPFYPAAQIFIDLRGTSAAAKSPEAVTKRVINCFEPSWDLSEETEDLISNYNSILKDNPSILVLDDVRDTVQVSPLVPELPSAAIITSRGFLDLEAVRAHELGRLDRSDSIAVLIAHLAEHQPTEAELDKLAEACADHPLSLRVAGTYLLNRWDRVEILDYASQIQADRAILEVNGKHGAINVMAVLALSFNLLRAQDGELAERWRDLSVFPADFDALAASAVWGGYGRDATVRSLNGLADLGMLESGSERGRFQMHELMRELARHGQPEARFNVPQFHYKRHCLREQAVANDLYERGSAQSALAALARLDRRLDHDERG